MARGQHRPRQLSGVLDAITQSRPDDRYEPIAAVAAGVVGLLARVLPRGGRGPVRVVTAPNTS